MKIIRLYLKNFKNIEEESFNLNSRFTVVIGNTGTGKSTLLNAIQIAAGAFFSGLPYVASRHISDDEVRFSSNKKSKLSEYVTPTIVEATGCINNGNAFTWKREKTGHGRRTSEKLADIGQIKNIAEEYASSLNEKGRPMLPIIVYFGVKQLGGTATRKRRIKKDRIIIRDGYYTGRFGGTSAACPQVSGVAALILSLNNNLTQQEVFDIITASAEKVGGYTYNANGWSAELGFGRLNAFAALNRIPGRFTISGSNYLCSSENYTVTGLPSGSSVTWSSSSDYIATISSTGSATKVNDGHVTFTATVTLPNRGGTVVVTKFVTVGTLSPWVGATFNDGGSGPNVPITSTFNEVFHRTVYITLWGSPSEFNWTQFYANGNTTWYHPAGYDGLVINFGDPLPVFNGDYLDFSIERTNACGTKSEPNYFYYNGPTEWYRASYNAVQSTITISQDDSENKSMESFDQKENPSLRKILIIDKTGTIALEKTYSENVRSATIDVANLTSGVYLLRIFTESNVESYQIEVEHKES